MGKPYETPSAEKLEFGYVDNVVASSGQITKNPGNHHGCTVMPNGKPIPENAVGYPGNR